MKPTISIILELCDAKEEKKCIKNSCLHVPRLFTLSLRHSRAAYEQNIVETAISNPKVLFRYVREGTKKRDTPG